MLLEALGDVLPSLLPDTSPLLTSMQTELENIAAEQSALQRAADEHASRLAEQGTMATKLQHEVLEARRTHEQMAAAQGLSAGGDDELGGGSGGDGAYTWSQTDEDVEVRVLRGLAGIEGKAAKKRIAVRYGRGDALVVTLDGAVVLDLPRLFDRVTPDECTWTLDKEGTLIVTMEKADARPWADLTLPNKEGISL